MNKYAVHLSDLSQAKQDAPLVIDIFLKDILAQHPYTVAVGKGIDDYALILDGIATDDEQRMDAVIELLLGRIGKRALGRRFRVYQQGPRGGWRKL